MDVNESIFRQYDIRGVVGRDLNADFSLTLGKAFGTYLKQRTASAKRVSVGRDVRLSSDELARSLMDGMASTGLDVVDIGVCPTPLQYFSLYHLDLDGGIMVTGSHNPPEYNGFKLSAGKETLFGDAIQGIRKIIENGWFENPSTPGTVSTYEIIPAYRNYLQNDFEGVIAQKGGKRRLMVVVDAGNGTAGLVAPDLLRDLGCEVIELYCEPDGNFPNHHPDPTVVEYIQDLIRTVKEHNADLGVGYDGDADRIGVVDREGRIIWGDQLMVILSRAILGRNKGAKIIGDVKCSQAMFDDIEKHGGTAIMNRTGHSLVKDRMRTEVALLAGEFSGHIFIAERYFGYDDAIYTTLRLVEIMMQTGRSIRDLLEGIPDMVFTPEIRIDCPESRKEYVVEELKRMISDVRNGNSKDMDVEIRDIITIDGIRVVFDRGWGLLRASNTQPVLVMRFEAEDDTSLAAYRTFMEDEVKRILKTEETL